MQENRDHNIVELERTLGSRYEDYRFLSQGGMGKVFIARDTILDKKVVIKLLQSTFDDNQAFIRFQREAQTSSKLSHTNIVGTLDFGLTAKNFPYIVMDYIDGDSLEEIQKKEAVFPEAIAVEIACQIARGMSHAHSRGIIHRDLKTANIIISGYPDKIHATIIDFGLARRESQGESSGRLTRIGSIIGTPLYMSPEQASGKAGDERSDIYSLGCILFKMLTGRTPFHTGESISILQQKTSLEAPSLSQVAPDLECSPELENVVAKALEKDPENRQRSMQELENDLAGCLQPEAEEQIKEESVEPVSKRIKSKELVVSIATLILVFVLVTSVIIKTQKNKPESITQTPAPPPKEPEKFTFGDYRVSYMDSTKRSLIAKDNVTDEDLADIAIKYGNINFDSLILKGTKVKGSGLQSLEALPIKYLDLTGTDLAPEAYKHLAKIKTLKDLVLQSTTIDGVGLSYLENATGLTYLSLNSCKNIRDEDLEHLKHLKLKILDLVGTRISDQALVPIAKIKTLNEILLDNTKVGDRAIDLLKPCTRLNDIRISRCYGVTRKGLETLVKNWPRLRYLSLAYIPLKEDDLQPLYNLKKLAFLNLMDIPVSDSSALWISQNRQMRSLYLSNTRLTDKGINSLSNLPNLLIFSIHLSKNVSPEALEKAYRQWISRNSNFKIYTDIKANLTLGGDDEIMELFKKTDLEPDPFAP